MALDAELLDRFERDWNDAMANYEARTTATRMGNVQYDPASRTFAPQEVDPKVSMGIQNELFGPLQAKWGILSGRRAPAMEEREPKIVHTRTGIFSVDPFSGDTVKLVDVPERAPRPRTFDVTVDPGIFGLTSPSRIGMTGPEAQSFLSSAAPELRTNAANAAISQILQSQADPMALPASGPEPEPLAPGPSVSRTNEVLRRTKDGRRAVFDAGTKKFLRYAN